MTTYIKKEHIAYVTKIILNTREFCGNEVEAGLEAALECGYDHNDALRLHRIANFRANAEWNGYKKAAGVNPKYIF